MNKNKPVHLEPLERRQAHRETNIKQPEGEITLMYDGQLIELLKVKDVSPLGICIQTAEPARRHTVIEICYQHRYCQLEVHGVLVRQERDVIAINDNRYWTCIGFDPYRQAQNIALSELLVFGSEGFTDKEEHINALAIMELVGDTTKT